MQRPNQAEDVESFLAAPARRVDAATFVGFFLALQLVIPARLVISQLPVSLSPAAVFALGVGLWWGCAQFITTTGVAKGRNLVRTALFAYLCAMLATYGYAMAGYLPRDEINLADRSMVLTLALVGITLACVDGLRGRDRIDLVLKTLVVAGTVVAVVGALQFLFDLDLTRYVDLPGLRSTSDDAFVIERAALRRVAATTAHPIEFGVVCATLLPLAVHLATVARLRAQPVLRWRICAVLIAAGLMFSVSRSAIVGVAGAGIVLIAGWPGRRRVQALVVGGVFLVGMKVLVPGLLGTFVGLFTSVGNDDSIRYRTHDYAVAAEEIRRHLWLGRGLGTWYAPKHQVFDNQYLLSMVETGVIGTLALAGVFVVGIWAALAARRRSRGFADRDLGLTLAAMLVVPLLGCATFDLASFPTALAISFVVAGTSGALLRLTPRPVPGRSLGAEPVGAQPVSR